MNPYNADASKGVVCLFCGLSTALPRETKERRSAHPDDHRASLIRCCACGKEALYLAEEIVDLQAA